MKEFKLIVIFTILLTVLLVGTVNASNTNIEDDYICENNLKINTNSNYNINNNSNNNLDNTDDLNNINTITNSIQDANSNESSLSSIDSPSNLSSDGLSSNLNSLNSNIQSFSSNGNPTIHIISDSNYTNFFYSNGSIISGTINSGDTLYIQGTLTNRNFIVSIPLNIITTLGDGKLINGTITIINSGSGSNVTNLTFVNSNNGGHGVHLTGTQNNTIENCSFTLNGVNAYSIPIVRSNYNRIIGNTIIQTPNNAGSGQVHSLVVLGESHYNIIENNTLTSEGSNCIYFCTVGFADFSGGQGSNYNNISGNTIYGVSGDWCYAITVNGNYSNIIDNTVRDAQKCISLSGNYNNITNNNLQSKGTSANPGTAISAAGTYNIISNNYINQSTNYDEGIILAGTNSIIKNNIIFTINGVAIQTSNSENIIIQENSIETKAGKGISIYGTNNLITIDGNIINSTTGVCIILDKTSNTKFPKNVVIKNNKLNTTAIYSIDTLNSDDTPNSIIFQDQNNSVVYGNSTFRGPGGVVINPTPVFDGTTHYINETNYLDYFMSDGTLSGTINDRDILIISGKFYNLGTISVNRVVKIMGNNSYFYNTTFKITIDGARIELINVINSNNIGIIIAEANNVEINYCNITVNHIKTAYGIWISKSDNAKITNNIITAKGDFLTFGIFLDGANNCTIEKNIINITGTGELYNYSSSTCTDCENGTCVGGTCTGTCVGGTCTGTCVGGTCTGTCVGGTCTGTCVDGSDDVDGTHIVPEIYRTYGIIILGSDYNKIINNTVYASSALENPLNPNEGQNSVVGIDIYYDSHYNEVIDNYIEIIANDTYLYGMGVLGSPTGTNSSTAIGNIFKNNKIAILGPYFVTGFISGENSYNAIVVNNTFECWGASYNYGIMLEKSQQNQIINNTITSSGLINYGMEVYGSNDNIISNNTINILSPSSYSYGIVLYSSSRNLISYNKIDVSGNQLTTSLEETHHDIIPYGNGGILLMEGSNSNNITNNSITSSGEYAINCSDTSNNSIVYTGSYFFTVSTAFLKGVFAQIRWIV